MTNNQISVDQFDNLVRPLLGLPVSLPWQGFGSAIFLELGSLSPAEPGRRKAGRGQASIQVEWDWRVEQGARVLGGSSSSGPAIEKGIQTLKDLKVDQIQVHGQVPELVIRFSNGMVLRTMVMKSGDPEWVIRLPDKSYIHCKAGLLYTGSGYSRGITKSETAASDREESASKRWGAPTAEPVAGRCRDCRSFVRLDGHAHLLDYGVCTESRSPFDGRAVAESGGCPAFAPHSTIAGS
jgi:hypothetical protein